MNPASIESPIVRIRPRREPVRPAGLAELAAVLGDKARALECAHDARQHFAAAYARAIERVASMRDEGAFGNAVAWIQQLAIAQAGQYFRAMNAWDAGDLSTTPAPWRAICARARYEDLPPAELISLSAIVHTSYDLPLAFVRCPFAGLDPSDARRAFDSLPSPGPDASETRRRPWQRRPSVDREIRVRAWDDAMRLLDAGGAEALRDAFVRIETRVLLRVAG